MPNEAAGSDGPHAVDVHVGERIRLRRRELGVSQERLAGALGITFQQIQKYELGRNRVSASRLWDIARVLRVAPTYFYEGLDASPPEPAAEPTARLLGSPEGRTLARAFRAIPAKVRSKLLELLRAVTDEES